MKKTKLKRVDFLLLSLLLIGYLAVFSPNPAYSEPPSSMNFTSGEKIGFTTTEEMTFKTGVSMQFWSGISMKFSSTVKMQFVEVFDGNGILEPCDELQVTWPAGFLPSYCEWWEVVDPTGKPLGEFHVDWTDGIDIFHVDTVWGPTGGPFPLLPGVNTAIRKIDIIEPCSYFEVHWPSGWYPEPCTWWEIIDPETGMLTGFEFHVDWTNESCEFHIDEIIPGPYILPFPWYEIWARQKIPGITPCDYFVVEEPDDWWPEPCTWWEVLDPWSGEPTGYEFHVDWTNESCEFHVDDIIPEPLVFPFPVPYVIVEQKIIDIKPCDWFVIVDPYGYVAPFCSWWEVLDEHGHPTGLEFHVDESGMNIFHVDEVIPDPLEMPPTYIARARKKIDVIMQCEWYKVDDPALTPEPCSWWEILDDLGQPTGIEFHVDESIPADGLFHIDQVWPDFTPIPPTHMLTAEKKIDDIQPCDWFLVVDPPGFVPQPCSWWQIVWPPVWAGIVFHVDSNNGIDVFHIDIVDGGDPPPPPPPPPPWNVTAVPTEAPPEPWYIKAPYPDYAPSGMPDFDQRQWGTYVWQDVWGAWSHCGPVACANSIWWFDSKYEPIPIPPPTINDGFPLVQAYGPWDDHDPQNLPWLVEHLAYLMDCDGMRTGLGPWSGTYVHDMEAGLAQYLSWSGVNPLGDVNGDGMVDMTDVAIVEAALGSVPGAPNWNLAADIWPASTTYPPWADNIVDMMDLDLVWMNLGLTGMFYEHTAWAWEDWEFFWFIENEVYNCQDVVLLLGFYIPGTDYREGGHYVTVAGVNSTTQELLICNPIRDDFEAGNTPGRSPVPHVHPPEPPYITHNNASLVSQDAYHVTLLPSPSGYHWLLEGYFPPQDLEARIEYAVITSPLAVPDIAVTDMLVCYGQTNLAQNRTHHINVTVTNEGPTSETFTLTVYWNITNVIGFTSVSLSPSETKNVTINWVATQPRYANYVLSAVATPVPGEIDIADNTYIGPTVKIVWPGDVDADKEVTILDVVKITGIYGSKYPEAMFKGNSDIDCDGKITILDVVLCTGNYGYKEP